MAIIKVNKQGLFSGKIGTVVLVNLRGQLVLRSMPTKTTKPPSQAQLNHWARFSLVSKFTSSFGSLFNKTFPGNPLKNATGLNTAFAYHLENAVTGSAGSFQIAYAQARISYGNLPNATAPAAAVTDDCNIRFSWVDNSYAGKARPADTAILVVYCPAYNQSLVVENVVGRSALTYTVNAGVFAGETVETWVAFMSVDGRTVSDSVYTGSI